MEGSRLEKLFNIIYGLLGQKPVGVKKIYWDDLDAASKKVLDEAMNVGIPRDKAEYMICRINESSLCIAEYYDSKENFSAHYLLLGNEIIYINEF